MTDYKLHFRGGGFKGGKLKDSVTLTNGKGANVLNRGATWPFYSLKLSDHDLLLQTPWQKIVKEYSQIIEARLSPLGYISFHFNEPVDNFGFSCFRVTRIVHALESRGVHMTNLTPRGLKIAQASIVLQTALELVVILLIVGAVIGVV